MAKPKIEGRKSYQASGRVNWARFLPFAIVVFVVAALLAGVLELLFKVGFYLVLLVPIFAAAGLAAIVGLAVKKGGCRNAFVAGLLGAVAGCVLYLGYYYIGMVQDLGPEYGTNIRLLPTYIRIRMALEVLKDVHTPDSGKPEKVPGGFGVGVNWTIFCAEFGFAVFLPMAGGLRRSRKAYCEKCDDWMNRETTSFKPELGPGFVEALRRASTQSLAALFTSPPKPSAPNTTVAVDYCANLKEGRSTDCEVHLSVKQVVTAAKGITFDAFEQAKGKMLAQQVILDRGEIAAVLPRFSALEKMAGTTAAQALEELNVQVKPVASSAMGESKPVDPLYAGKVLTTKTVLMTSLWTLLGFAGVLGGIGFFALGAYLALPTSPSPGGVPLVMKVVGWMFIGISILIFVVHLVMAYTVVDWLGTRYFRKLIYREFARRPNPLVSPSDPDALLVQVIPRGNWSMLKLIEATDTGFLRVDKQRGELLFEGDKEYYRIPATAITSCEIEKFVQGKGAHAAAITLYRVVLQANHPSGFWEIPFAERGNIGKFRRKSREKWARELQQQIRELQSQASVQTTA